MYNLTFDEAIQKCFKEKYFIRGENFKTGLYVKLYNDVLVLVDGSGTLHKTIECLILSKGVYEQKYKSFIVANKKELEL